MTTGGLRLERPPLASAMVASVIGCPFHADNPLTPELDSVCNCSLCADRLSRSGWYGESNKSINIEFREFRI